jgi:hypothetical protein
MNSGEMKPLQTNSRWNREKTETPNRFNGGRNERHERGDRRREGRGGRGGGWGGGRGGGWGGGRGEGRGRARNAFTRNKKKQKPEFKYAETSFPTLGKREIPVYDPDHFCQSWVQCCEENLKLKPLQVMDWRAAANRGISAPPPKPKIKVKQPLQTINKNVATENIDYYSDEDECIFDDDEEGFPAKGGYID